MSQAKNAPLNAIKITEIDKLIRRVVVRKFGFLNEDAVSYVWFNVLNRKVLDKYDETRGDVMGFLNVVSHNLIIDYIRSERNVTNLKKNVAKLNQICHINYRDVENRLINIIDRISALSTYSETDILLKHATGKNQHSVRVWKARAAVRRMI